MRRSELPLELPCKSDEVSAATRVLLRDVKVNAIKETGVAATAVDEVTSVKAVVIILVLAATIRVSLVEADLDKVSAKTDVVVVAQVRVAVESAVPDGKVAEVHLDAVAESTRLQRLSANAKPDVQLWKYALETGMAHWRRKKE